METPNIKTENESEEVLRNKLEMTKRMLERTVKQKNKYKTDLELCRNENSLLKL